MTSRSQKQKRMMVRERKLRRSQSRWLQKALFALSKAQEEQAKLLELRSERGDILDVTLEGTDYPMDEVTTGLKEAVHDWLELQRTAATAKAVGPVT